MKPINHRLIGRLLLGASLTLTAAACKDKEDRTTRDEPMTETDPGTAPAATTRGTMSADDVIGDPDRFLGKKVRLAGEVDAVFDQQSFELEGDGIIFDEQILVVARTPIRFEGAAQLADDDEVVVEGTIAKLAVIDIERDMGFDLTPEVEMEYREKAFLIAESIRKVDEAGTWNAEGMQQGTQPGMQPGMEPGTQPPGTEPQPGTPQQPGTQTQPPAGTDTAPGTPGTGDQPAQPGTGTNY